MKFSILFILSFCISFSVQAQLKIGVKGGISTYDLGSDELLVVDQAGLDSFRLGIEKANFGFHAGIILRGMMGKAFFLQAEVLFNSNKVDYSWENLDDMAPKTILSENYNNLDIPLLLGLKAGPLCFNAGPVAHIYLNSTSDLKSIKQFEERFKKATFGWQGGVGINIWKILLEVRYEGNFNKSGEHFRFFGDQYTFSNNPSRILFSAGLLF